MHPSMMKNSCAKTYDTTLFMKQIAVRNYKSDFGGSLLAGRRKSQRPLSTRNAIHLVIRSTQSGVFAPGNRSLERLLSEQANRFSISIYRFAANWSHIHIVLKIKSREDYTKFIRSLTSVLSQAIRKSSPGRDCVFELRPFTRILKWGRDFKNAMDYQILNQLEARGLIKRVKNRAYASKSVATSVV